MEISAVHLHLSSSPKMVRMSQINKNELSCRLKAFSLICAVLVVFVHCVPDEILGAPQFSPGWWINRLWTETVCRMAVPAFFFMSGYWLAKHAEKNGWWKDAIRKRLKSLLVPYVIWNVGYWALVTFELWLGMRFFGKAGPEDFTWRTIPDVLGFTTATPFSVPHWFIKQLMLFVLLVPPFAWMIKRSKMLTIIVVFGTLFIAPIRPSWCFVYIGNMFYFLGGFAVMIWWQIPRPRGWQVGLVCFACAMILQVGHEAGCLLSSHNFVWGYVRSICIIPLIAYAVYSFAGVGLPCVRVGDGMAFPIYLTHCIVLHFARTITRNVSQFNCIIHYNPYVTYVGMWGLALVVSVAVTLSIRRLAPRVADVVYGGR